MFPDKSNPQQQEANYSERLLVGYRFYDRHQIEPAFPFGHVSRLGHVPLDVSCFRPLNSQCIGAELHFIPLLGTQGQLECRVAHAA